MLLFSAPAITASQLHEIDRCKREWDERDQRLAQFRDRSVVTEALRRTSFRLVERLNRAIITSGDVDWQFVYEHSEQLRAIADEQRQKRR